MWRKRWVKIVLLLVVLLIGGLSWVIYSVKQVRPFYTAALAIPKEKLHEGNREFLNRASRLKNDLRKPGEWQMLLTDEQINGWLAVDLVNNHPDALPAEILHPRVDIDPTHISLGATIDREPFPVAASLDIKLQLTSNHEVALRVITARLGNLPWPVESIIAQLRRATTQQGWTVRETTIDNDPVLLLKPPQGDGKGEVTVEALELREGEIYLRGKTTAK